MSNSSASLWVKFFSNAGIPSPANASYAHIFFKNRIAMDMLTELNKEYLREMGIIATGDIISILRHAKNVSDQTVRDKILIESEPVKFVAKINPVPVSSSAVHTVVKPSSRRVLPEHEGKYKISLPKGSTKKSREILAKHSALQSDKIGQKSSIFDRLTSKDVAMADSTSSEPQFKVTSSSSIFKRLGSYKELEKKIEKSSIAFSGILKNSPTLSPLKGVTKHRVHPRFKSKPIMRDLIVESSDSSMGYESDDKMEMDELKQVSFSPDVEVREFNRLPRQLDSSDYEPIMGLKHDGIKARLGRTLQTPPSKKNLHTVKTVAMKPVKPSQSVASRVGKMKSDNMTAQTNSIHSRLTITSRSRDTVTKMDTRVSKPKGSSVFNRLGRNK